MFRAFLFIFSRERFERFLARNAAETAKEKEEKKSQEMDKLSFSRIFARRMSMNHDVASLATVRHIIDKNCSKKNIGDMSEF